MDHEGPGEADIYMAMRREPGLIQVTTPDEMYRFICLIIYMGFVQVPRLGASASTGRQLQSTVVCGLATSIMSRDRFKALLGMIHLSDPADDPNHADDKLCKIRPLLTHIQAKCAITTFSVQC